MTYQAGTCRLLFGPMFSKKTTRLIEEAETLTDLGIKCLFVNHIDHQRETAAGDIFVSTHHSQYKGLSSKIDRVLAERAGEINSDPYKAIFFDEGQFFPDIVDWTIDAVFNKGKIVIIASLDGDANLKPFGRVHDLESICEQQNIVRLTAFCKPCLKQQGRLVNASFTAKLNPGGPQKEIGASDKYMPVCMKCYLMHTQTGSEPVIKVEQLEAMALPVAKRDESKEGTVVATRK